MSKVDPSIFDEYNEISCYTLGYIFAMGSLYERASHYEVTILGSLEQLQLIRECLRSDHSIVKIKHGYRLRILSKELMGKLKKEGLRKGKSENMKFPRNIPRRLMRHFIRGYFDGKGGFIVEEGRRVICMMTCGNKEFLEELRDELISLGMQRVEVRKTHPQRKGYSIRYYTRETKNLYLLMYHEANIYDRFVRGKYDTGVNIV